MARWDGIEGWGGGGEKGWDEMSGRKSLCTIFIPRTEKRRTEKESSQTGQGLTRKNEDQPLDR